MVCLSGHLGKLSRGRGRQLERKQHTLALVKKTSKSMLIGTMQDRFHDGMHLRMFFDTGSARRSYTYDEGSYRVNIFSSVYRRCFSPLVELPS